MDALTLTMIAAVTSVLIYFNSSIPGNVFSCYPNLDGEHEVMNWIWCPRVNVASQVPHPHTGEIPNEDDKTSKEATAL